MTAAEETTRRRTLRLMAHVEGVLIKPSTAAFCSFAEIAAQLREIIGEDVTDDEIVMAAHRVRDQWRRGSGCTQLVIEANYRWLVTARDDTGPAPDHSRDRGSINVG